MNHIVNPYIAGAPVTETSMFFGREDVFDWIRRSLTGQFIDHILVIHGQRRVGKTSVLKQLQHRLPERYVPVFFDLQGRTHTTLDRFLWWLAREIERVLMQDRGIAIPKPERQVFIDDPDFLETHFFPQLRDRIPGCNLLLTFDEFDTLEEEAIKEELARPLIDYLRRLMGQEGLNFIFSIGSSGRKLENMQASYTEFFKAALYKKITFLEKENAYHLITRPVDGVVEYDREAVKRIYDIASGHPYFTQLVCHEIFSLCQKTGQRKVEMTDVEAILDDVVERGTVNLKFVWDEASDLEKWSLAALAHMEKGHSTKDLEAFLQNQRVRFNEQELQLALLHLREKDVLTNENRFVIYLLQRWLQKNRPMERVREELTELNPIANRYIEIGLEFQNSGLLEKAIESYQEALAVDTDNLRAQVNLAAVYLQQKDYAAAVLEYKKALAIDEEDVAARAGLCEAHLALGDLVLDRGRIKEAIRSFEEVLAINAEHTEARQRMADIHRQRAEQAVTDRKYDEAIASYKEALNYTPEDVSLETQYQEILIRQRSEIISGLMAKVERARSAKRWEEGITILMEALDMFPGDERLQRELKEVQEAQRTERLKTLLTKAEQASKSGRWEDATGAYEEYLTMAPDDLQVKERLTGAKASHRAAQLQTLKAQARSHMAAENWDGALASWKAYLELEPEDRAAVMDEMKQTELSKERWQAYDEARQAFAKKDYDRAVRLLKGIVIEDETYKDASRLMAEAIELRRTVRPFWRNRWLWGAIGGLAVAAAGFGLYKLGIFSPPSQLEATSTASGVIVVEPTLILTLTPSPTPTELPTTTPTPVPLLWSRLSSGREFSRDTITAIAMDPSDPGVIYVGTQNAGIYKSINGGISWQPMHKGLGRAWIHTLVIDHEDPRILYAGVSLGGVYKTMDGGENWHAVNEGIDFHFWEWVSIVAMDHQDSQHLYYTPTNGIYESLDGGETWAEIQTSPCPPQIVGMVVNPIDGKTLFAASWPSEECEAGVYKSVDAGRTWALASPELQSISFIGSLEIDSQKGDFLYVVDDSSLYGSSDSGENWIRLPQTCSRAPSIDPQDGAVAYCANGNIVKTTDGGQTWQPLAWWDMPSRGWVISVSPHTKETIFVGSQSLYLSTDDGVSWIERSSGLGGTRLELKIDPSDSSILYANSEALYRSSTSGRTWEFFFQGRDLTFDADGNALYASADDFILRSWDNGQTWENLPGPDEEGRIIDIATHPRRSGKLYALYESNNQISLYISSDGGNTWQEVGGMGGTGEIQHPILYFDHDLGETAYAVGDWSVFRSNDAGNTWEACAQAPGWFTHSSQSALAIDPRDSNRFVVATQGKGVLLSLNGCKSWVPSNEGLGNLFINTLAIDPLDSDTVYAGTDGGAYVSFDGGEHWGQINEGLLGATVVYSILVDSESNVYAATPYGVFRLEAK